MILRRMNIFILLSFMVNIMVVIKNEYITAKFNELGAELKSLSCDGKEYIWPGDDKFWSDSAPVLFPICSGLLDDTYYYKNKAYHMEKHGYASGYVFEVVEKRENYVSFLHKWNEKTYKIYPFRYELYINYELVDKKLNITYKVNNLSDDDMYFSIGGHEGFICEGGIENYELVFPKKVNLDACVLGGSVLGNETERILENSDMFNLDYKYFTIDAIILKNVDFSEVILKNNINGNVLKSSFEGFPYLLFWTRPDAPLLCIEPWCGITDGVGTTQDITVKEGIEHLNVGETFNRTRTIEIF